MRYECQECQHVFGEREVLCIDWRDPAKSFLCPHCETALRRPEHHEVQAHLHGMDVTPSSTRILYGVFFGVGLFLIPVGLVVMSPSSLTAGILIFGVLFGCFLSYFKSRDVSERPMKVVRFESV